VQRITGTSPKFDAGTCTACGPHWATTVISPAPSIGGPLLTPQLRTAALMATLRTEVTHRSGKRPGTMTVTISLPATEVISIDAMASVNTVVWRCRLCDHHGTTTIRLTAHSDGIEHLRAEHHVTIRHYPLNAWSIAG
jgi:hypothetical protein